MQIIINYQYIEYSKLFAARKMPLCYVTAMLLRRRDTGIVCALSLVLAACGGVSKKPEVWELYSLPQTAPQARPSPLDNDSYYYAPKGFSSCNTIGDNPSCSGGG